eukprot:TRINITY_DN26054_c0_g1_i3.p1 TRINITY_DN26054_c0_g1~~TRINITY_DN26054_c0_g1_i3.p1  ORF type:complete len:568 (-),score=118.94 TRINITY_DN26054_c0_g1_i3:505-2208(-)
MQSQEDLEALRHELALAQELMRLRGSPTAAGQHLEDLEEDAGPQSSSSPTSAVYDCYTAASQARVETPLGRKGEWPDRANLPASNEPQNEAYADGVAYHRPTLDSGLFSEGVSLDDMPTPQQDRCQENQYNSAEPPLPAEDLTLARAKALIQITLQEIQPDTPMLQSSCVGRLRQECDAARARIKANVASLGSAAQGVRCLESLAAEVEHALSRVRHARSSRWADLAVCEMRLKLLAEKDWLGSAARSATTKSKGRLKPDRQALLEAIEMEQQALLQSRRELTSLETETSLMLKALAEARSEVSRQAAESRTAMRSDHTALVQAHQAATPRQSSKGAVICGPSRSPIVRHSSGKRIAVAKGGKADDGSDFINQRLQMMQSEVLQLCDKCSAVIQYTDKECSQAAQASRDNMAKCSLELQVHRKKFEVQLKELDYAISSAEFTSVQANRAKQKPVESDSSTGARAERASVLLHELRTTRRHLNSLLRRSIQDCQLVEACRKVSPSMAAATPGGVGAHSSMQPQKRRPSSAGGPGNLRGATEDHCGGGTTTRQGLCWLSWYVFTAKECK